jgi:hypothetical protein
MVSEDLPEWFNSTKKKEEKKIKKRIDSHTTWWAQSHRVSVYSQLPNLAVPDLPAGADVQIEMRDIFETDIASTKNISYRKDSGTDRGVLCKADQILNPLST